VLVICPAFVSDCLETLEEIGIRARESFIEAGGTELTLIPCLNTDPKWITSLQAMVTDRWPNASVFECKARESVPCPVAK
jgi:protoheme ferro-lyase